ncbi:MAG: hypothetical protein RLZZ385_109 [Pseudomonadota bacterium]|jgi:polyvinyl alcohol dehydrogenase (cytochrome)
MASCLLPRRLLPLVMCFAVLCVAAPLQAQPPAFSPGDHPGSLVFQRQCATCHGSADFPLAPTLDVLQTYSAAALEFALVEGLMAAQGSLLSITDRALLIDFLVAEEDDRWVDTLLCAADNRVVDLSKLPALTRVGIDANSSRAMTAEAAGLTRDDMTRLELAWAIGFPGTGALRAAPVIVGNTLFYAASGTGRVFALDARSGCARWVFESPTPLRSSLTFGRLGAEGPDGLLYGDSQGHVYALAAATGELLWTTDVRSHGRAVRITGAPVLHGDRVIVPISDSGVGEAANPDFECCIGHGAVTALAAIDGAVLWEYHTMPEADYTGERNARGVALRGPSGAPIWSTPTVDGDRGLVYVTTGENTSHPATSTSDAIIALELDSGQVRWQFQALANDVWNQACGRNRDNANCPNQAGGNYAESVLADYDFGGPAVLVKRPDGDFLLAGQKSGDLWALDPDTGTVRWQQRIGDGTALGGNHWGIATDGNRVFMPVNDPGVPRPGFTPQPGMYSFFVASGETSWSYRVQPDCDNGRADRVNACDSRYGLSAMPLLVDGALLSASLDGRLLVFDKDTGDLLFQYDTVQDFTTANGVAGKGGSIDAHSLAAGAGMVFVGSGYGRFNQTPGNVLLAFRPRSTP